MNKNDIYLFRKYLFFIAYVCVYEYMLGHRTTVFLRADTTAQNSTRCKRMKGAAMIYETDLTRVYYTRPST